MSRIFGVDLRDLFQVHPVNMSIAIWVGFLALFGIASDDAVVICTYLDQRFGKVKPATVAEIREATVYAGKRRIRACLMTTATTVLALLPVLTSTGRGSDIMLPMSLPVLRRHGHRSHHAVHGAGAVLLGEGKEVEKGGRVMIARPRAPV